MMQYQMETRPGGVTIFRLRGRLDAHSYEEFRAQLKQAANSGQQFLIVDMEHIAFIDSSGLSALVAGFRAARAHGGQIVLTHIGPQVKLALELTRLNQVFTTHATTEEALEAIADAHTTTD